MSMYTDPKHIRVEDPGQIEGNVVFMYLDAFAPDQAYVSELKAHYQRGGLGDVKLKNYLLEVLNAQLAPIREKRLMFAQDKGQIMKMLLEGTSKVQDVAAQTMLEVRKALKLNY